MGFVPILGRRSRGRAAMEALTGSVQVTAQPEPALGTGDGWGAVLAPPHLMSARVVASA